MLRNALAVTVVLIALVSGAVLAGPIDTFINSHNDGSIHNVLGTDPVDLIESIGEEPAEYDYYSGDSRMFAYVDSTSRSEIVGLTFAWSSSGIEEIRLAFSGDVRIPEALAVLGYFSASFKTFDPDLNRLGNIPYRSQMYRLEDALPGWGSSMRDVDFIFLLSHFTESVFMLIATY